MKNLRITILFITLSSLSIYSLGTGNNTGSSKLIKLISKELGIDKKEIQLKEINSNCLKSKLINSVYRVIKEKKESGFVIEAEGKGRYDYFYYIIYYSEEREVEWIKVTKYYSDHGGEITSRSWLKQFFGYSGEELKYGKDIQAISGATISATAITKGIEEITIQLQDCEL